MTSALSLTDVRKVIFKIPLWQLLIGCLCAVFYWLLSGGHQAFSALSGALISTVGSLVFAITVFALPTHDSHQVVKRMFKGELLKMMVVAILFYWSIKWFKFDLLPLIIGFSVTFVAFWVTLLRAFR